MFAQDAKRMGYYVVTLDPQEHSPCGQVADEQIVAAYADLAAIEELGRRTDVVTYEFENIDIASVRHLELRGSASCRRAACCTSRKIVYAKKSSRAKPASRRRSSLACRTPRSS